MTNIKHPKKFILNKEEYIFFKEIYKNCYEYRSYWINGSGEKRYFHKYIEKGNILYDLYQKHLKGEKIYNDIQFID